MGTLVLPNSILLISSKDVDVYFGLPNSILKTSKTGGRLNPLLATLRTTFSCDHGMSLFTLLVGRGGRAALLFAPRSFFEPATPTTC